MTITLTPRARLRSALVAGAAILALALSACGGSSPDESTSKDAESSLLPAAEGKTEYPLTLETPWGETVLEKRPERVGAVAIDGVDTELLLALGVTPVTTSEAALNNAPWSVDAGADKIETVFQADYENRVPAERIASAQPDLLVALNWDLAEDYEKLSEIAPVLGSPEEAEDYWAIPWQEQLRWMGKALDLQDRAEQVISDHETDLEQVKKEHPEFAGTSAAFAVWFGGEYGATLYSSAGSTLDGLFQSIGFEPSPNTDVAIGENISPENYAELDQADVLIVGTSGDTPLAELTDADVFKSLSVVQDDRVIYLDSEEYGFPLVWSLGAGQLLAHEWVLDQIVPLLSEKLE